LIVLVVLLMDGSVLEAQAAWSWTIANNQSSYLNQIGYFHVVGEVQNTGDQAMKLVKITATFYNASNTIVAARYGHTTLDLLPAGRKSPFDVALLDPDLSAEVHNYTLQLNCKQASVSEHHVSVLLPGWRRRPRRMPDQEHRQHGHNEREGRRNHSITPPGRSSP
jgi:hypothetical protein